MVPIKPMSVGPVERFAALYRFAVPCDVHHFVHGDVDVGCRSTRHDCHLCGNLACNGKTEFVTHNRQRAYALAAAGQGVLLLRNLDIGCKGIIIRVDAIAEIKTFRLDGIHVIVGCFDGQCLGNDKRRTYRNTYRSTLFLINDGYAFVLARQLARFVNRVVGDYFLGGVVVKRRHFHTCSVELFTDDVLGFGRLHRNTDTHQAFGDGLFCAAYGANAVNVVVFRTFRRCACRGKNHDKHKQYGKEQFCLFLHVFLLKNMRYDITRTAVESGSRYDCNALAHKRLSPNNKRKRHCSRFSDLVRPHYKL